MHTVDLTRRFLCSQCASLLALAAYYSSGQSVPIASVVALLVYVGCYQVQAPLSHC